MTLGKPSFIKQPDGTTVLGIEATVDDMRVWNPSMARIRDAILGSHITAPTFHNVDKRWNATQREIDVVNEFAPEIVRAGRVFDFGFLPNSVIKAGGTRGGPLQHEGALPMPFREPWMFVHTWDSKAHDSPCVAVYLVNPLDDRPNCDAEVVELQPITITQEHDMLAMGDRVRLLNHSPLPLASSKYECNPIPAPWRMLPGANEAMNGSNDAESAAAGNCLDPLMTVLTILHTRGIERSEVAASDKLNRARAKNRKFPIPPYTRVDADLYVSTVLARQARQGRGEPGGGTHASPVAHIRIGHFRNYESGQRSFIRDTLVNVTDEARAAFKRSHYQVRS